MNREEIKTRLEAILPGCTFEEGTAWLTLQCEAEGFLDTARLLRQSQGLDFDYLFCVTAVDWKTHLTMVYHFTSTQHREPLVVKVKLDRSQPVIDSLSSIWRTAEFHEREAYDLMGVLFTGHPDLRRLFLTPEHEGYPLRKDYEDPVNLIKL